MRSLTRLKLALVLIVAVDVVGYAAESDAQVDDQIYDGSDNPASKIAADPAKLQAVTDGKASIDALMAKFNSDLNSLNGDKPDSVFNRTVAEGTKQYAQHQQNDAPGPTPKNWMTSPIYEHDIGLAHDPGDGAGFSGPKETVNFATYRDPSTIENPTLRSLQTSLNKITAAGQSANRQVNDFSNRVRNSNNYFAKALQCSGFDWGAQFNFMIDMEAMKNYVTGMAEVIAAAAPMALLGAYSPQLAELVKHMQMMMNFQLSADKMDCSAMQAKMQGSFEQFRSAEYSRCMQENYSLGIEKANQACQQKTSAPRQDGTTMPAQLSSAPAAARADTTKKPIDPGPGPATNGIDPATPIDEDTAENLDYNNAQQAETNTSGSSTPNSKTAATRTDSMNKTGPNASIWQSARGTWDSVSNNTLYKQLTNSWHMSATCTMDVGKSHWEPLKGLFDTESVKGANALETDLLDHFILLTGKLPTGAGNPPQTLAESYDRIRTKTYSTRRNPWLVNGVWSQAAVGTSQRQMEKYQFNDQVVDGMSLVLWRRANFAGDVVRIDREYNIGQCIESIMRFEIIFWYKNQFDRMAQEVRKATSDLKTGTETNKDFLGDIERQITDIEQRIDKEITEAEGKFVPYLPKFYDIRMPKQQRPKENPDSGGTAQVFTDDSSAFPIHPK